MKTNRYDMVVLCPNEGCKSPIKISVGKYVGDNDKGGFIIQCEKCLREFPCTVKNPHDLSGITSGGKVIETWLDDYPDRLKLKFGDLNEVHDGLERALVFNYEAPPKVNWMPSNHIVDSNGANIELHAHEALKKETKKINSCYRDYTNWYLKGSNSAEKSFVILTYEFNGISYTAIFAKQIDTEHELNANNLYLIHHTALKCEELIDGIYTRNQAILYLERLLNRWRYVANEVLLVVPFIGFHYKSSEEARHQLWNWLSINVNVDKTQLITRKGTFKLFKQAQDSTGIPFDELVKWGLLEPLFESLNKKDATFFERSHAKYYVGVYPSHVEVLSGSFNIHTGGSFENITFKSYQRDLFSKRYLHMFKDYEYLAEVPQELVHYINIDTGKNLEENDVMRLDQLRAKYNF